MDFFEFNDFELIYLIRNHNERALRVLYKKYEIMIYKLIRDYKVNSDDIDDVISDLKLMIYQCIRIYNDDNTFYTFFIVCAKRVIYRYFNIRNAKSTLSLKEEILADLEDTNRSLISDIRFENDLQKEISKSIMAHEKLSDLSKRINVPTKTIYYEFAKLKKYNNR